MDEFFLRLAIKEAKKSKDLDGYYVGAVIVKNGKIISKAYGEEKNNNGHAEELAIQNCKENLQGSTLYVTIEPCDLRPSGKKSCCDLIINSGIKKVIFGVLDPAVKVPCSGVEKLKKANIELLHLQKLEQECKKITPNLFSKVAPSNNRT